jgi:hypothetical protein
LSTTFNTSEPAPDIRPPRHKRETRPIPWSLKSAFLICFAYANCCFFDAWQPLQSRHWDYFLSPPVRVDVAWRYFFAILTDITLLTLILWGLYAWIIRSSITHASRIVSLGFLALLLVPLNLVRTEFGLFGLNNVLVSLALLAAGVAAIIWHSVLVRPLSLVLMFSWPLLFVEMASSAVHIFSVRGFAEPAMANPLPGVPARRLVWVVFDEFDEELAFDRRLPGLHLPNLDVLKAESLSGNKVYRSQRTTPLATSSLLLGKVVSRAVMTGPTGLTLTFADGERRSLPFADNVFSIARSRGLNTAVSGWYIPYCRLFSESLTNCVWAPGESSLESIFTSLDPPVVESVHKTAALLARNLLGRLPGMERIGLTWTPIGFATSRTRAVRQVAEFEQIRQAALRFSTDPGLGLVYLHFPIPHIYGIYNPTTSQVEPGGTYWDNLVLVDRMIGELRSAMEAAGLWDSTAFLVSSDHSLRRETDPWRYLRDPEAVEFVPLRIRTGVESPLIPFILKLPSQQAGIRYESPFNAVLTRDLLLSVLSGGVVTPEQAVHWLDVNRRRVPLGNY